jgi:hypothetical protein
MDIEQLSLEAGRLHDAASLLNRLSRESPPPETSRRPADHWGCASGST